VDALNARAIATGIKVIRAISTQFYGDRSVSYEDPFGHYWGFASHVEDVSGDEMKRRAASMGK
jgi:PhnB protein